MRAELAVLLEQGVISKREGENPLDGLLREVHQSALMVEYLRELVVDLEPGMRRVLDEYEGGPGGLISLEVKQRTFTSRDTETTDTEYTAKVNLYWQMWCDERDRHAKLCKLAIDAGLSERLVRLREAEAQILVRVLAGVLRDLGVDPEAEESREVVRRHLVAVSGSAS